MRREDNEEGLVLNLVECHPSYCENTRFDGFSGDDQCNCPEKQEVRTLVVVLSSLYHNKNNRQYASGSRSNSQQQFRD